MTEEISTKGAVLALIEHVPEIAAYAERGAHELNAGEPYIAFGVLASFLTDNVVADPKNDDAVLRSFALLNEMCAVPHGELANIAAVSVFEALAEGPATTDMAREHLVGPALGLFERVAGGWS